MLSDRCPVCLSCPVCNISALWPNGWMDQDEIWHAVRPRTRTHCVRWSPSSPHSQPPNFRPISLVAKWLDGSILWPNGYGSICHSVGRGRPFVKRFALCYRTVVCPVLSVCLSVCLSVMLVYCCQTVRWMKLDFAGKASALATLS